MKGWNWEAITTRMRKMKAQVCALYCFRRTQEKQWFPEISVIPWKAPSYLKDKAKQTNKRFCTQRFRWFCGFQYKSRKKTSSKPAPLKYPETILHTGKKEKHSSDMQIKSEFSLLDACSHVPEQFLNVAVIWTPHQASGIVWQLQADVLAPQGFVRNPANSCLTIAFSSWLVYHLQSKGFQLYLVGLYFGLFFFFFLTKE